MSEEKQSLISSQANVQHTLLNVKTRTISRGTLERGLVVLLVDVLIYLPSCVISVWECLVYVWLNYSLHLWPFKKKIYNCICLLEYYHREKRHVHDHKKNTCPLLLVADYRFFRHMGRGQESITLNYLVCLYEPLYCSIVNGYFNPKLVLVLIYQHLVFLFS